MIADNVEPAWDNSMISFGSKLAPEPKRETPKENCYKNGVVRVARFVGKKLFNCDVCGKDFSRKEYLQIHQKNHLPENPFTCKICGRVFERSFPLKKHEKTHEKGKKQEEHCKDKLLKCEKSMGNSSKTPMASSDDGKLTKNEDQSFSCHVCGKVYQKSISVKRHASIHKKKPFFCSICKRNFVLNTELQQHLARHVKKNK